MARAFGQRLLVLAEKQTLSVGLDYLPVQRVSRWCENLHFLNIRFLYMAGTAAASRGWPMGGGAGIVL